MTCFWWLNPWAEVRWLRKECDKWKAAYNRSFDREMFLLYRKGRIELENESLKREIAALTTKSTFKRDPNRMTVEDLKRRGTTDTIL